MALKILFVHANFKSELLWTFKVFLLLKWRLHINGDNKGFDLYLGV